MAAECAQFGAKPYSFKELPKIVGDEQEWRSITAQITEQHEILTPLGGIAGQYLQIKSETSTSSRGLQPSSGGHSIRWLADTLRTSLEDMWKDHPSMVGVMCLLFSGTTKTRFERLVGHNSRRG